MTVDRNASNVAGVYLFIRLPEVNHLHFGELSRFAIAEGTSVSLAPNLPRYAYSLTTEGELEILPTDPQAGLEGVRLSTTETLDLFLALQQAGEWLETLMKEWDARLDTVIPDMPFCGYAQMLELATTPA